MDRTSGGGGRIPRERIREIADRVNIVEVVAERVADIKKRGAGFWACCPFHDEKTPSFHVRPDRQTFHCFGCGEGGDVYDFLMKVDGLTFREALEDVARRAGVELPRDRLSPEEERAARRRTSLLDVNELAAGFYRRTLMGPDGAHARAYLERRGIPADLAERFRLGYAPDAWESLTQELGRQRFDPSTGEQVGLLRRGKRGGHYDLMRDRLMIPIMDARGKVVAFGGRAMGDAEPKYLNSPESTVYDKSGTLYGLGQVAASIRRADRALVVEGYFDCLALVAAGFENVVAICGTALTPGQVRLIRRHTSDVTMVLDGDQAGLKAAFRSLEVLLDQDVWPTFVGLPEGQDPDDVVRHQGPDAFRTLLGRAEPLLDRLLQDVIARHRGSPRASERVLEEVAPILSRLKPVTAQPYWAWLADQLRIDERMMMAHVRSLRRAPAARQEAPRQPIHASSQGSFPREEWALLALLLQQPERCAREIAHHRVPEMMRSRPLADLARVALEEAQAGHGPDVGRLLDRTDDPGLRRMLTEMTHSEGMVPDEDIERLRDQLVLSVRRAYLKRLLDEAKRRSRTAEDIEEQQVAAAEAIRLKQELHRIASDKTLH